MTPSVPKDLNTKCKNCSVPHPLRDHRISGKMLCLMASCRCTGFDPIVEEDQKVKEQAHGG